MMNLNNKIIIKFSTIVQRVRVGGNIGGAEFDILMHSDRGLCID